MTATKIETYALIAVLGYLLGSIPFGYLLVRMCRGEDVRQSGSGNIGATNVSRKSAILGLFTLLLDAAKGAAAVILSSILVDRMTARGSRFEYLALGALCAIVGHIFPVWLKFRGGKGVATGLGSFALLAPKAVLIAAALFVLTVLVFRFVSLASIAAVVAFPILAWFIHQFGISYAGLACIVCACLLIVARHHENIRRLLAGTERRIGTTSV
jgi:acyl phosphate:glycerol-3-phosphate acyltransferase